MTTLGWHVIGGGTGAVLGFFMHAPFDPAVGMVFGYLMGLLIFSPLRANFDR